MSVVINYVTKYLSVIATDTRIVYGKYGGLLGLYSDDNEKLFNLESGSFGWIAGAGLCDILDEFKDKIAKIIIDKPINIDVIVEIYKDCLQKGYAKWGDLKRDIDNTAASISYLGYTETENDFSMRIGILSKKLLDTTEELPRLDYENFFVLFPSEYIDNRELVEEFEKKFPVSYPFKNDLNDLLLKILGMFLYIKSNSSSVSNICDIGLYLVNLDGIFKIRIRDDAATLVKCVLENKISEKMQIIKQISFHKEP